MPNPTPAARRRWQATLIIALSFVAVAAAAGIGWWYARESPPHQGPIVLISVDAMQARRLPAYGGTAITTPAIDALAADGVLFTRAYAHSPQTLPAHVSLLTGQLPLEHGVRDDGGYVLREEARTMAEQLRSRGFTTGAAVSSFLLRRASGAAQGFSFYDAALPDAAPGAPPPVERDGLQTYAIAERWMQRQDGQRYFLFLEVDDGAADTVVARVVQHLKDKDLYDGATIILTAAHGDPETGIWLDDRSLAIPLIVKQPDAEGAGRSVEIPVQQIDLLPTLLDLVRAPSPGGLRGRSLRPILDSDNASLTAQPIYAESLEAAWRFGGTPVYALTLDGYRLTRGAFDTIARVDATVPADPAEQARGDRLRAALDRLLSGRTISPPGAVAQADETAYAAAGYLPGLRTVQPLAAPADADEQAAIADAHRAAVRLVAARQYGPAIAALKNLARRRPDLAPVQFQIASLLARTGRVMEAIAGFVSAAMLRPEDPGIATALASTQLRARQLVEAKAAADQAVTLAEAAAVPAAIADAHEVSVRVALAGMDAESAALHAAAAQKADLARPLPAFVRGRLAFDEGKHEEALTAFQEAARILRDNNRELVDLHVSLGDALAGLDRYPDAEAEFKEELRAFPDNIRAYASLTTLYRAQNRDEAVAQTIEELLAAAPTAEGYTMAARLWTIVGERAKADALRADARRRFRGDPSLANLN